ncbi:MAG: hypothetical protein JNG85_12715 [Spirochaetaceae bacterium]|nr:hypothetical protein [Spirochaetaceae bacterium]
MSAQTKGFKLDPVRLAVRAALVLAYLALGAAVFLSGRTHTVIVDYKGAEDGSYQAVEQVSVTVGENEALEYMGGDFRDKVTVRSQRQKLVIEPFSGGDKIEKTFTIPVGTDVILLSVAKAAAGIEPFVETFVASTVRENTDDAGSGEAFTSPESTSATDPATAPPSDAPPAPPAP